MCQIQETVYVVCGHEVIDDDSYGGYVNQTFTCARAKVTKHQRSHMEIVRAYVRGMCWICEVEQYNIQMQREREQYNLQVQREEIQRQRQNDGFSDEGFF